MLAHIGIWHEHVRHVWIHHRIHHHGVGLRVHVGIAEVHAWKLRLVLGHVERVALLSLFVSRFGEFHILFEFFKRYIVDVLFLISVLLILIIVLLILISILLILIILIIIICIIIFAILMC